MIPFFGLFEFFAINHFCAKFPSFGQTPSGFDFLVDERVIVLEINAETLFL